MRYLVLISSLLTFAFCGCTTTDTVTCHPGQLAIYGLGFTSADFTSNSTITTYKADGLFDSTIYAESFYAYSTAGDTMVFEVSLMPGQDYKILLPDAGKEYKITNIRLNGLYKETFSHTSSLFSSDRVNEICFNGIKSCDINGTTYYPTAMPPNNYSSVVYLTR